MSTKLLLGRETSLATAIAYVVRGIGFVTGDHQGRLQRLNPERAAVRSVGEKECARVRDWLDTPKPKPYSHSYPCSVDFGNPRIIGTPCTSLFLGQNCLIRLWARHALSVDSTRAQEMTR